MVQHPYDDQASPPHPDAVWRRVELLIDYRTLTARATLAAWHSREFHDAGRPPIPGAERHVVVSGAGVQALQSGVGAAVDAAIDAATLADPQFAGAKPA